ncbi:cytochrome P450 9e2 [Procambarus clarkii]|uniref:cytochrome P450 9e2 n=1 Tax=Procambarus clarkii TaxID=6728 RepID=UPI001E672AFF|nr:cytochrome P450 9e2-like [Procambarus clarkii]
MIGVLLLCVAVVMLVALAVSRRRHSYWSRLGVPTPPYLPVIGHLHKQLSKSQRRWMYFNEVYYKHGGATFCGLYELLRPVLMIGDPNLLKHIFVKDFDHFVDRRITTSADESLMNEMLSNKTGDDWKSLRSVMSPTFTSGKMRSMFPLICDKADSLVSVCLKESARKPFIDMKHNFGCFTMDTIASCAFGIESNSLGDEEAEFAKVAESFFNFSFIRIVKFTLLTLLPSLYNALRLKTDTYHIKFFQSVVSKTIAARKAGQRRGDFLDLLMEAQADHLPATLSHSTTNHSNSATDNHNGLTATDNQHFVIKSKVLSERTIVAQSVMFLIAGYDTTASTLAFSSYLLAKNPTHQQRLRQEVEDMVKEHGNITYQGIMEAKYLDACLQETLRLYPPATFAERLCTKNYKIPGTELILRAGDLVTVPIWSLHHDPRYWPEPEEFQPDRFLPENKTHIKSFTHLPFGMGPRNCIAMRFALMEAKVALAKLVLAADLHLSPGHKELKISSSPFILRPEEGVNLVLKPIIEAAHS